MVDTFKSNDFNIDLKNIYQANEIYISYIIIFVNDQII